jgi:hypothetical protein
MQVYIVKHYWKEKETATWKCHERVDKKLFEYLKKDYSIFVSKKPKIIKKDKYFIYPCYKDDKDIYNRTITNIDFFIAKRKVTYDFCNIKEIKNLMVEIPIKIDKRLIVSVGIVLLLSIIIFYFSNNSSIKISESKNSITILDYSDFIDNWNRQVQNNTDKKEFLLPRGESIEVISKLNSIIYSISRDESNETKWDNYTQGLIKKYKRYREKHYQDFNITFDKKMTQQDIKNKLKQATKEDSMSGIVKEILMMNDIEIWEKVNQK